MRAILSRGRRAQTNAGVVLDRLRRSRARPGAARARAASGVAASGAPRAPARNSCAASSSGKLDASHALQTTPPAAPEKPVRWSCAPHAAQAASCGANPAASSSLRRNASWFVRVARAGSASSSASSLQSRLKTSGCGSSVSNRRETASHARAAASSAAASVAQARVAVDRLGARDREQLAAALVEHEVEAEERLEPAAEAAARAPHALGDRADPAAVRGVEVQDPVGLAVADRAQHDRLRS